MRKLLVNAQITAVISSIEFFFFIAHIVGVYAAGGTNSGTGIIVMVMYMVLFMIILPYAFLMNTSFNKKRIAENGWINVVKNITTNNSIMAANILSGSCLEKDGNEPRNEIFMLQEKDKIDKRIHKENNPSIDQALPSSTDFNKAIPKSANNGKRSTKVEKIADTIFNPDSSSYPHSGGDEDDLPIGYEVNYLNVPSGAFEDKFLRKTQEDKNPITKSINRND